MKRRVGIVALGVSAVGLSLGACTSNPYDTSLSALEGNPSPALDTLSQRHEDIDIAMTIANDENLRMLNEDIGHVLMLDRPSRLNRRPVP